MRSRFAVTLSGCLAVVLAGCASTSVRSVHEGSAQEPAGARYLSSLSAIHSEMNLRMKVMMATDDGQCGDSECTAKRRFEERVSLLGERLSRTAFLQFPELTQRFEKFSFVVADKSDYGVASSDAGTIVVFRAVDRLGLDDPALAFVLAREMAHVIVGHHEDNTMTSLVLSLAAQVLMPMFNVARGAAAAVASNTAVTSAMTSAAVMAGNEAIRSSKRPEQLKQAEELSLGLLVEAGFSASKAVSSLQTRLSRLPLNDAWVNELSQSIPRIEHLAIQSIYAPEDVSVRLAALDSGLAREQQLIAAGADPSKITQASATGFSSSRKFEGTEAVKPSVSTVQQIAMRSRAANSNSLGGHWGMGGYSERAPAAPVVERTVAKGVTTLQESPTTRTAKTIEAKARGGYWGPWGYTERTVTESGEEGLIVKTVSAEQASAVQATVAQTSITQASASDSGSYIKSAPTQAKRDKLVPPGYFGMWGYGP